MPYIPKEARRKLAPVVEALPETITEGEASYLIAKIALRLLKSGDSSGRYRYANLARVAGVLYLTADEFVRAIIHPYEDLRRMENGTVWNEGGR